MQYYGKEILQNKAEFLTIEYNCNSKKWSFGTMDQQV